MLAITRFSQYERLSIVDANAGAQPLYNAVKTHVLAVNGEIYNHQTLRASMAIVTFQTGPTAKLSSRCIRKKYGFPLTIYRMFAFALYDSEKTLI